MNNLLRKCIVYDYETDHVAAGEEVCNPVQLGAVVVDLRKKVVIPDSQFNIDIRPPTIDDENYIKDHHDTIKWHCGIQGKTEEEVVARWKNGMPEEAAWSEFLKYVESHGKSYQRKPIQGGMNIRNFDMKINDRLHKRYKTKNPFWARDVYDIQDLFAYYFLYSNHPPKNYKLDTVRDYLQMSKANAHDALQDVMDTANILCRFLNTLEYTTVNNSILNGEESFA